MLLMSTETSCPTASKSFSARPTLRQWGKTKIFSTTSDGGLNLKKMVNALEDRVDCTSVFPDLNKPIVSDSCAT